MRVTKVMKDYAEKQVNEKYQAVIAEYRKAYDARREDCKGKLEDIFEDAVKRANVVLREYGMDEQTSESSWSHCPLSIHPERVSNEKEESTIRSFSVDLRRRKEEMLENFYLECDLGCDRDTFKKMVEDMKF